MQIIKVDFKTKKVISRETFNFEEKQLPISYTGAPMNLLLSEMQRFQEKRTMQGKLDLSMVYWGKLLFKELALVATTNELRILSESYLKHLELEEKGLRSTNEIA